MTQAPPQHTLRQLQRLAKFSRLMDGWIKIPFVRRGFGLDAILSAVPVLGDAAGFLLTLYSVRLARRAGVPHRQLLPAYRLAVLDFFAGSIPVIGLVFDIAMRPSTKVLAISENYLAARHQLAPQSLGVLQAATVQPLLSRKQRWILAAIVFALLFLLLLLSYRLFVGFLHLFGGSL